MIFRILEDQLAQKSKQSKAADQRFMQLALTLGRRGQGRTRHRIGRGGSVLWGRAVRGCPPRAEGQEDSKRTEPSQRDLLSPLPGTTADFPGDGLPSESPGRET